MVYTCNRCFREGGGVGWCVMPMKSKKAEIC